MIGAFIGFVISLPFVIAVDSVSNWWMLWAALIGFFFELVVRLGGGGGFGDALLHFGAWSWVASETT
jgi:hypothetical protein